MDLWRILIVRLWISCLARLVLNNCFGQFELASFAPKGLDARLGQVANVFYRVEEKSHWH